MTATAMGNPSIQPEVREAIQHACDSIAPTWPLDRMIAVNPYWQQVHQPFSEVAATLDRLAGSPMAMPMRYYRNLWQAGVIQRDHLNQCLAEQSSALSVEAMIEALEEPGAEPTPAPLLCDALDQQRDLLHEPAWCDTITHQIAQFCAAYFDREQADWHPNQSAELYSAWRHTLSQDHSVALLMKAPDIPRRARALAEDPETRIQQALEQLAPEPEQWPAYLQAVLLRISGWASGCAYRRWQARLEGGDDHTLIDLLAIRLSWESLIDDGKRHPGSVFNRWHSAWLEHFQAEDRADRVIRQLWQRAHEISYQQTLFQALAAHPSEPVSQTSPDVQAVFCIDVRSEVFRRHLEGQSKHIQTSGFAGFFGLPISYRPLGTEARRPQLPGLLAPALDITDTTGDPAADDQLVQQRQQSLKNRLNWRAFTSVPASAFTLVETLGLGYVSKLIKRSAPGAGGMKKEHGWSSGSDHTARPSLITALGNDLEAKTDLATRVLKGMNLTRDFAPLVLLVGHGSQTENNPQRAGLDCGACCGQTGEVNARALAALLNDTEVRLALRHNGINVPGDTWFIAGLHNTTTDEVTLFDTGETPAALTAKLGTLTDQLAAAGQAARRERASALGLKHLEDSPEKLHKAVKRRANDWAQTRPEWGLANNAAFVVAPRARTRGLPLYGRSFLHDYDHHTDPGGELLEQIMTAPMVVTHWINMQYYASTVDNQRYGSGNKTLHNVVGGRLGVFEGNGGDLRIGLAWQSIHDGEEFRHEPLRLTVVINAPRASIERVMAKHEVVRQLVNNRWLYLARMEGDDVEIYQPGTAQPWCLSATGLPARNQM
ncbi:DUF2309 domain-containing protein [Marinobacter salinisoli]|uniref:Probable inorganic carbon transporter subunit DabA n=1 Tax=Marinobacter salinisoli TaxID=2769486 RepID=A0ABX7MRU6_9GAMM|nr:DUF2309 domain-containing protein [Marinobacter salinisoli]QSP95095.1 DUF2309 domain-containing protein [Marinobacter salinisoli]